LSRIEQKTVLIAYADSVRQPGEASLATLENFLQTYFPAIRGLHMLPACEIIEGRFNDGYFSQVVRDRVHPEFGTNRTFARMMGRNFSMADFVLNHVDIENPQFRAYLAGDDAKGDCFYVFGEEEYQARLLRGDFKNIFRPRPFPLFTIFRRVPRDNDLRLMQHPQKVAWLNARLAPKSMPEPLISLLSIFNKIKNDQMLLDQDYRRIEAFRTFLQNRTSVDPGTIFKLSTTQETQKRPFIFQAGIKEPGDLLLALGYDRESARRLTDTYLRYDPIVFGQEIRALTTFSHVQVDLNTTTEAGLRMLADDFAWYLGMDLDMLRLDAANFAFKRWGSSCFGLPEVKQLMEILYLSMDCVAPRIVANLEVNDTLTSILTQMADKKAPPPMMYDFHLACMLPAVFNAGDATVLERILATIDAFDIPKESIRFSLAESHDGKSVRGSLDLLTLAQRQRLADTVVSNGGRIKFKSVPKGRCDPIEFGEVCSGAGLQFDRASKKLFRAEEKGPGPLKLHLKESIASTGDIARALQMSTKALEESPGLRFFVNKVIHGREPYELCVSTWDSLIVVGDVNLGIGRYLAFYTLAFALMGRNVKSIYFNDLLGLENDHLKQQESGELRDIKRTKSDFLTLKHQLNDKSSLKSKIARKMNNLIALVDSDPALHYTGEEARIIAKTAAERPESVAIVQNRCAPDETLVVINLGPRAEQVTIHADAFQQSKSATLYDNISAKSITISQNNHLAFVLQPYQRMWLTPQKIEIPKELLVEP
jgi:hypothetical protein